MQALSKSAAEAGITVVNEVGLDPGIDHFLAMECFDDVHTGGGKVESFVSFCGGLPAPEASDNPLGYKFSWSPRGALMNMLSGGNNDLALSHLTRPFLINLFSFCTFGAFRVDFAEESSNFSELILVDSIDFGPFDQFLDGSCNLH